MRPVRTLIVDDEPIARRGIRLELASDPDMVIVGECRNARQAIAVIKREKPDLMFLDIQMPKRDGFSVIEAVGLDAVPSVVFVTAYDEYALRAFDANAIDYVLKPIDPVRFKRALAKAKQNIQQRLLRQTHSQRNHGDKRYLSRIIVRSPRQVNFFNVEEIEWIEAADNYVRLHVGTAVYLHRDTVKNLEKRLNPEQFIRIRRSTIVNTQAISRLRRCQNGEFEIVLSNNRVLVTSRRYRKNLKRITSTMPQP